MMKEIAEFIRKYFGSEGVNELIVELKKLSYVKIVIKKASRSKRLNKK